MAAVARLTRNLSQERATVLAKQAIELSTTGNLEVSYEIPLSLRCVTGISVQVEAIQH